MAWTAVHIAIGVLWSVLVVRLAGPSGGGAFCWLVLHAAGLLATDVHRLHRRPG